MHAFVPFRVRPYRLMAVMLTAVLIAPVAHAQHSHGPVLHVNPRWKECSIQLDRSLTRQAFRQFVEEAGIVTYFRPLVDARPMGRGRWEVAMLQWKSGIDDADAAWNDTFVHPDSAHWLLEGSGLNFPGVTARVGVGERTDVGAYFTKSPGANYGFYGAQIQQNLIQDERRNWSAAARVSLVSLYGPEDLDFQVYGADLVASRQYEVFNDRVRLAPYVSASASLSRGHEKSALVTLPDERVFGAQASAGAVVEVAGMRLALEYSAARVSNLSMKIGIGRGGR